MNEDARKNRSFTPQESALAIDNGTDEIDILAVLNTIWRGKWVIAFFATIGFFIGGYFAFVVAVPMYKAQM